MSARAGLALLLLLGVPALAADRFAVIVGNNEGSARRPRLWFAEADAERFAGALRELGDFDAAHVKTVRAGTVADVQGALAQVEGQVQAARALGHRTVLVFYFSGHAGAGALELGAGRLEFTELKRVVEASAADVKVAIVDACESGALTQVKGARPTAALDFPLPTDETARGVAYIASTAVGEAAQESAAIGGSYFTFHLEAALRGAGDANGDGQVSMAEAFQYTSSRTITNTTATDVGPQHPTYNFRMSGRGDVVLADLRRAEATLALGGDASSTWVVSQKGRLVAEAPGGLTLALPAGDYRVERRAGHDVFGGDLSLSRGEVRAVGELPRVVAVATRGKGGAGAPPSVSAAMAVGTPMLVDRALLAVGARLGVQGFSEGWGLRLGLGYEDASGQLVQGGGFRLQTGAVLGALLRRLWDGRLQLDVGLELGAAWTSQSLDRGASTGALSGQGAAVVTLGLPLGPVVPQLQALGGARLFHLNGAAVARPLAGLTLGLAVEL